MDIYIVCNKCGHMTKIDNQRLFEEYRPLPCCSMCKSEDIFIVNHELTPKHIWDKFQKAAEKESRILEDKINKAIEEYLDNNKT